MVVVTRALSLCATWPFVVKCGSNRSALTYLCLFLVRFFCHVGQQGRIGVACGRGFAVIRIISDGGQVGLAECRKRDSCFDVVNHVLGQIQCGAFEKSSTVNAGTIATYSFYERV